jgi:hypothetical protein
MSGFVGGVISRSQRDAAIIWQQVKELIAVNLWGRLLKAIWIMLIAMFNGNDLIGRALLAG